MQLKENCTFYSARIICAGPKAQNLSYEERNIKLWKVLKDDFSEKNILSVTTPNGEKTFAREYDEEPTEGIASVIYSCENAKYLVNYFMTDHSLDIGIDNLSDDINVAIIAEALECSLNKTLAKHSLSIKFEKSSLDNKEETKILYFNFALGNISSFK
jgi:hypothetical protein